MGRTEKDKQTHQKHSANINIDDYEHQQQAKKAYQSKQRVQQLKILKFRGHTVLCTQGVVFKTETTHSSSRVKTFT